MSVICARKLAVTEGSLTTMLKFPARSLYTVQPKVLAKALGAEDLKALVHKEADGPGVCVQGSTGKALVRAVKEDKKVSRFANLRNLSPLLFSGIQTSGVMSAGMQDENSSRRCLAQIFQHAWEVQISVLSVPIAILPKVSEASSFEDVGVVGPGWVGVVDGVSAKNPVEEMSPDSQRASATQSLEGWNVCGLDLPWSSMACLGQFQITIK